MGRRAALAIGAMMLATAPGTAARAQDPTQVQAVLPPEDMPPADGARMVEIETQALAAIEAGDWASVERLVRQGLALEQRHYAPDDARIGHSWGWLARAAIEQGRAPQEVIPLAEKRLEIALAHPEDGETLATARHMLAVQLLAADRAAEAAPLLRDAERWLAGQGEAKIGDLRVVRGVLGRAQIAAGDGQAGVETLAPLLAEMTADPSATPGDLAFVAWELGVTLYDFGRFDEAAPAFRIAFDRRAEMGSGRDTVVAGYWLSDTLQRLERTDEADAVLARIVTLDLAAPVAERGLTVDQLRGDVLSYGDRRRVAGQWEQAAETYRLAVEANRRQPDDKTYLAAALSRLGLALQGQGRLDQAQTAQIEALALWRETRGEPHKDVAVQLEQLGRTQLRNNRHLDAARSLTQAASMRAALGQETALDVLDDQADATERAGRLEEALVLWAGLAGRLEAQTPQRPDVLAEALGDQAHTLFLLDRHTEAEAKYRQALVLATQPRTREALTTGLAFALAMQGRGDEGEPLQRQVLADVSARVGAATPLAALAMNDLAHLLNLRGEPERAEPLVRDALAIFEAAETPDRVWIATLKLNLGVIVGDLGRRQEALPLLLKAYQARREIFGPAHPATITAINLVAYEYIALGAYDRAEPLFGQMVRVREAQVGPDHPMVAEALQGQAYALQSAGRYAEAEVLMRRAVAIIEVRSQDPRERIRYNANWGASLLQSGRPAEALDVFRRAQAAMVERRRAVSDPSWSRSEGDGFRFLHRFAVQAAWETATPPSP